jgi:hypothetical protein
MSELPLKERHYARVPGAVSRLDADVPESVISARAATARIADDLLGVAPDQPLLVPSADGAIKRMLFTVPLWAVTTDRLGADNPYGSAYRDLLLKLPTGVEPLVLTHRSGATEVERWLADAGLASSSTVVEAEDYLGFSIWAEDGYVALHDPDRDVSGLVEPAFFPRYGDALVADYVRTEGNLGTYQAPLYFQGGNVLVGDDFFLIGIDYPTRTLARGIVRPRPGQRPVELLHDLYRRFFDQRRAPLFVGTTLLVPAEQTREFEQDGETWTEFLYRGNEPGTRQPLFHIDMFISLAGRGEDGRYTLLVGDPREAARLTGEELRPEATAEVFDNIAEQLARLNFDVRRNPLPLTYVDDRECRERLWYFATANNALVHRPANGETVVLLPSYGHGPYERLQVTDERNKQVWEELGFEVRMLGDFHPFAVGLGAVHCIKKYLNRA